jgi:hypothetical protein
MRAALTEEQADAVMERLHDVRRAQGKTQRFEALRAATEAIYVLAGRVDASELTEFDARLIP